MKVYKCKGLLLIFLILGWCNVAFSQKQHTIQRGETYELIAKRYNITLDELMAVNPDEDGCFVGMVINIPESSRINTQLGISTPKDLSKLDDAANLVKSGKYKKATSVYSNVIKQSSSASAYFGRGISYYNREKYKSAIEDFERAQNSADCTDEMRERCKELISNAESLRAEQHERRNSIWGSIAAVFVSAAAVTATAMTANNSSGSTYMPPSNMNGFQRDTSLDYLLDPRYAIMQVQQEEMAEYEQFKKLTGQDITIEQYRMLKYSSNQPESDSGGNESDNTSTSSKTSKNRSRDSDLDSSHKIQYGYKDCPHCMGSGKCKTCNGTGIQDHMRSILCGVCYEHNGKCRWCLGKGKRYGSL